MTGSDMPLLHFSITATDPEHVARELAVILGGRAMPFPPFPDSWIAFGAEDNGTAIEVYPVTHILDAGETQVDCLVNRPDTGRTFAHAAIGSPLEVHALLDIGAKNGWLARKCNRGPFECVEIWLENRLLIEVLDQAMQADYRKGMTMANWQSMFGLD
ncbi:hypothetical protein [Roseibium sp. MMSF_3544]|uniref:hypothetical protein n=1 Tax=unclassified Roseibium TaxID=2629323 RepID=UPI00273D60F1|nr:hypothetical protein [Roseibium sp. MMSF_3544]